MGEKGTYLHSADRWWWWNGVGWMGAYSEDHRWWFDGVRWVPAAPAWQRWTRPSGLVSLVVGWLAVSVAGLAAMGDPGRGQEKVLAAWVMPVGNAGMTLIIIGLTLCVASPLARRLRGFLSDDPLLPR